MLQAVFIWRGSMYLLFYEWHGDSWDVREAHVFAEMKDHLQLAVDVELLHGRIQIYTHPEINYKHSNHTYPI